MIDYPLIKSKDALAQELGTLTSVDRLITDAREQADALGRRLQKVSEGPSKIGGIIESAKEFRLIRGELEAIRALIEQALQSRS